MQCLVLGSGVGDLSIANLLGGLEVVIGCDSGLWTSLTMQ